jgi:hypothetical protein
MILSELPVILIFLLKKNDGFLAPAPRKVYRVDGRFFADASCFNSYLSLSIACIFMPLFRCCIVHERHIQYRAVANPVIPIAITLHQPIISAESPRFRIWPYAAFEIHRWKGKIIAPEMKYPLCTTNQNTPLRFRYSRFYCTPPPGSHQKNI